MYTANQSTTDRQNQLQARLATATTAREVDRLMRAIQQTLAGCFYVDQRAAIAAHQSKQAKLATLKAEHGRRIASRENRKQVATAKQAEIESAPATQARNPFVGQSRRLTIRLTTTTTTTTETLSCADWAGSGNPEPLRRPGRVLPVIDL